MPRRNAKPPVFEDDLTRAHTAALNAKGHLVRANVRNSAKLSLTRYVKNQTPATRKKIVQHTTDLNNLEPVRVDRRNVNTRRRLFPSWESIQNRNEDVRRLTVERDRIRAQINGCHVYADRMRAVTRGREARINKPTYNSWEDVIKMICDRVTRQISCIVLIGDGARAPARTITYENMDHLTGDVLMGAVDQFNAGGSDESFHNYLITTPSDVIRVLFYGRQDPREERDERGRRIRNRQQGAYFKYTHTLPCDFSRYQIYRDDQEKDMIPCLLYALTMCDNIDPAIISSARRIIVTDHVGVADLEDIACRLGITISLLNINTNSKRTIKYNKGCDFVAHICLVDEHYFVADDQTRVTEYALANYGDVRDAPEWNRIRGKNQKGSWKRENRYITSPRLVEMLLADKETFLKRITDLSERVKADNDTDTTPSEPCECIEEDFEAVKYRQREKLNRRDMDIIWFDFETKADGRRNGSTSEQHEGFMVDAERRNGGTLDHAECHMFEGENCGLHLLRWVRKTTVMYAHFAKYDMNFLFRHLFAIKPIEPNGSYKGCKAKFWNTLTNKTHDIYFRDTHMMLNFPLSKFGQMFFTENERTGYKKDVMPYGLYTTENIDNRYAKIDDASAFLDKDAMRQFRRNISEWNVDDADRPGHFRLLRYAARYCRQDVKILVQGFLRFRKWVLEITDLDIIDFVSISSLANAYCEKEGCYEGVYKLGGMPREFIQGTVVGARTMISYNRPTHIEALLQVLDANQLYPSIMSKMGYLKGKAKVITAGTAYDIIKTYDGYFVEINVTSIGREYAFPCMNRKNKAGIREFRNDLLGVHRVCKTDLEDWIKYHEIEFEIIRGYYFDEGFNDRINQVMKTLTTKRYECKQAKNQIHSAYKLLANSIYGFTILKTNSTEVRYFDSTEKKERFCENNPDVIMEIPIYGCDKWRVTTKARLDTMKTLPHIGSEILSRARSYMNQVMYLAEEMGIDMYYQDNDSMHMDATKVDELAREFKKRTGLDLIGDGLFQFKYELADQDKYAHDPDTIPVCKTAIYVMKKTYIEEVSHVVDGVAQTSYCMRAKGIPSDCLQHRIDHGIDATDEDGKLVDKKVYDGDSMQLYQDVFDGSPVTVDLMKGGATRMVFSKDFTVKTRETFLRTIKI